MKFKTALYTRTNKQFTNFVCNNEYFNHDFKIGTFRRGGKTTLYLLSIIYHILKYNEPHMMKSVQTQQHEYNTINYIYYDNLVDVTRDF